MSAGSLARRLREVEAAQVLRLLSGRIVLVLLLVVLVVAFPRLGRTSRFSLLVGRMETISLLIVGQFPVSPSCRQICAPTVGTPS